MMLIRAGRNVQSDHAGPELRYQAAPPLADDAPLELPVAPALEQTVRERHQAGHSQRAIARELNLDRRKSQAHPRPGNLNQSQAFEDFQT